MGVPSSGQLRLNADINLEINGTGSGTDVSLNGLSISAGFSAPNGMEEFYGYVDAIAPSVTTSANSSVGSSSMTSNGNVTADGGATITQRGFYFGTSSNYASNPKYSVAGTTGAFSRSNTGLSGGTTYYSTAYAINSVGETRGSTISSATSVPVLGGMSYSVIGGGTKYSLSNSMNIRTYQSFNNGNGFAVSTYMYFYAINGGSWNTIRVQTYGAWPSSVPFPHPMPKNVYVGSMPPGGHVIHETWSAYGNASGKGAGCQHRASASGYSTRHYGTIQFIRS